MSTRVVRAGVLLAICATALFTTLATVPLVVAWYAFLGATLALDGSWRRPFCCLLAPLTLYSTAASWAWRLDVAYVPWLVTGDVIDATTRMCVASLAAVALLAECGMFGEGDRDRLRRATRVVRERVLERPTGALQCAALLLVAFGTVSWLQLVDIGIGSVLTAERRAFADQVFGTGSKYFQLLAVPISMVLLVRAVLGGRASERRALLAVLAWAWMPTLLVGARKELYVLLVAVLLLGAGRIRLSRPTIIAIVGCFLLLPVLFERRPLADPYSYVMSFHEFILPQYSLFVLEATSFAGWAPLEQAAGYGSGAWFMVPAALRPVDVVSFGEAFGELAVFGGGIGAHPIAEATWAFGAAGYLAFPIAFALVTKGALLVAQRWPELTTMSAAYLLLIGRGDLWNTIFFSVYGAIVLTVLLPRTRRGPSTSEPVNLDRRVLA